MSDSSPASSAPVAYKRILLKLSGEVLAGQGECIDAATTDNIARELKNVHDTGVEIAIVIGGGNIWRGATKSHAGMDRTNADYMGMLATIINGLGLQDALERQGVDVRVQSALAVHNVAEPYIRRRAIRHMEKGRVVVFVAGTSNPYFSTDSAAALRAIETNADVILKATKVDGVYDSDPKTNPSAVRFETVSYADAISKQLKVMDTTAFALCQENKMPIIVFDMFQPGNIMRVIRGEQVGTLVS